MACPTTGRICPHLTVVNDVTFDGTNLVLNVPNQSYENGDKYCLLLSDNLPADTTIAAPVVVTIGDSPTEFPVVNCNCTPCTACEISGNRRYSTVVHTGIQGGVFQLTGPVGCSRRAEYPDALVPAAVTTGGEDVGETKTTG